MTDRKVPNRPPMWPDLRQFMDAVKRKEEELINAWLSRPADPVETVKRKLREGA